MLSPLPLMQNSKPPEHPIRLPCVCSSPMQMQIFCPHLFGDLRLSNSICVYTLHCIGYMHHTQQSLNYKLCKVPLCVHLKASENIAMCFKRPQYDIEIFPMRIFVTFYQLKPSCYKTQFTNGLRQQRKGMSVQYIIKPQSNYRLKFFSAEKKLFLEFFHLYNVLQT